MLPYPVQKVVPLTTATIPSEDTSRIKIIVEGDDLQNDSNFVPDNSFLNSSLSQSTTFSRDFHDTGFNDIYKASSSFEIDSIWGFQPKKSVNVEHDTDSVDLEAGGPTIIPETRDLPIDEAYDTTPPASDVFSVGPLPDGCTLPLLGVSVDFLVLVRDLCVTMYGPTAAEKLTTRDVADRLFAAWRPPQSDRTPTSPFPTSFLSHFQSQYSRGVCHPALGCCCSPLLVCEATVFVTHCWSYTFDAMVAALQEFSRLRQESGEPRPFFWLDFFLSRDGEESTSTSMSTSMPSPSPSPSPVPSPTSSSPARPSPEPPQLCLRIRMGLLALRRIGRVCVLLLPWSAPLTLRDGRCLLELLAACTRDHPDLSPHRPQCELMLQLSARRHLSYLRLCSENFQVCVYVYMYVCMYVCRCVISFVSFCSGCRGCSGPDCLLCELPAPGRRQRDGQALAGLHPRAAAELSRRRRLRGGGRAALAQDGRLAPAGCHLGGPAEAAAVRAGPGGHPGGARDAAAGIYRGAGAGFEPRWRLDDEQLRPPGRWPGVALRGAAVDAAALDCIVAAAASEGEGEGA